MIINRLIKASLPLLLKASIKSHAQNLLSHIHIKIG